jgi:hypothetical protein
LYFTLEGGKNEVEKRIFHADVIRSVNFSPPNSRFAVWRVAVLAIARASKQTKDKSNQLEKIDREEDAAPLHECPLLWIGLLQLARPVEGHEAAVDRGCG